VNQNSNIRATGRRSKRERRACPGKIWENALAREGQGEICTVVHPSQDFVETSMADVIRIQDRKVRIPPHRPPAISGGAKVLLFTGIRYERLDRDPQPTAPDGRRIKKQ
jgi:hypothetical protein